MGRLLQSGGAKRALERMVESLADVERGIAASTLSTATWARRMLRDQSGAAGIEYGLIIVGISIAIMAAIFAIGGEMSKYFGAVDSGVEGALGS